jgi:hypothetical protein
MTISKLSQPVRIGATIAVVAIALAGCQSTKRALGLNKTVPDEFAVAAPAPLSVPPDFNLRPPAPGEDRPQQLSAADQARAALIGRARLQAYQSRGLSKGEASFLSAAGVDGITPNIRTTLDKEVSVFAPEDKSFTNKLLFWRDDAGQGTIIDPAAEMKRLNQNAAAGKKPNEGPIPIIGKNGSSFLGIF